MVRVIIKTGCQPNGGFVTVQDIQDDANASPGSLQVVIKNTNGILINEGGTANALPNGIYNITVLRDYQAEPAENLYIDVDGQIRSTLELACTFDTPDGNPPATVTAVNVNIYCGIDPVTNSIGGSVLGTNIGSGPYTLRVSNTTGYTEDIVTDGLTYLLEGIPSGTYTIEVVGHNYTTESFLVNCEPLPVFTSEQTVTLTCGRNLIGTVTRTFTATGSTQEEADKEALVKAQELAKQDLICNLDISFDTVDIEPGFTLSYQPTLKSFTSFHSYHPHIITTVGDRLFLGEEYKFEELNIGKQGEYFSQQYPSTLTLVSNDSPLLTKSMDNIVLQSTKPLSSIKVVGETKASNINNLIFNNDFDYELMEDEVLVRWKNNQYQMTIPRCTDFSRFKDKWVELQFSYDNISPINLKYLTMLYRVVSR